MEEVRKTVAALWRDDPAIRTMAEIEELLAKSPAPKGCQDSVERLVSDLLYRDRWRGAWGPRPGEKQPETWPTVEELIDRNPDESKRQAALAQLAICRQCPLLLRDGEYPGSESCRLCQGGFSPAGRFVQRLTGALPPSPGCERWKPI